MLFVIVVFQDKNLFTAYIFNNFNAAFNDHIFMYCGGPFVDGFVTPRSFAPIDRSVYEVILYGKHDTTLMYNETLDFQVDCSDDDLDNLSYYVDSPLLINGTGFVTGSFTEDDVGDQNITVSCSDGTTNTTQSFTLTVEPLPPEFLEMDMTTTGLNVTDNSTSEDFYINWTKPINLRGSLAVTLSVDDSVILNNSHTLTDTVGTYARLTTRGRSHVLNDERDAYLYVDDTVVGACYANVTNCQTVTGPLAIDYGDVAAHPEFDLLYAANENTGTKSLISVYNYSDRNASPVFVNSTSDVGTTRTISILSSKWAITATNNQNARLYDISDPKFPVFNSTMSFMPITSGNYRRATEIDYEHGVFWGAGGVYQIDDVGGLTLLQSLAGQKFYVNENYAITASGTTARVYSRDNVTFTLLDTFDTYSGLVENLVWVSEDGGIAVVGGDSSGEYPNWWMYEGYRGTNFVSVLNSSQGARYQFLDWTRNEFIDFGPAGEIGIASSVGASPSEASVTYIEQDEFYLLSKGDVGDHNVTFFVTDGILNYTETFSYTTNPTLAQITSSSCIATTPLEGSTTIMPVSFNITSGTSNLTSSQAVVNLSSTELTSSSCSLSQLDTFIYGVDCNVTFNYDDPAGFYDLNVSVYDGVFQQFVSLINQSYCEYLELIAADFSVNFQTSGELDDDTAYEFSMNNTGNSYLTNVSILASDLQGATLTNIYLDTQYAYVNTVDSLSGATQLVDGEYISVTSFTLDPGEADNFYILFDLPADLYPQIYYGTWQMNVE